jgi:hypothetical protein
MDIKTSHKTRDGTVVSVGDLFKLRIDNGEVSRYGINIITGFTRKDERGQWIVEVLGEDYNFSRNINTFLKHYVKVS